MDDTRISLRAVKNEDISDIYELYRNKKIVYNNGIAFGLYSENFLKLALIDKNLLSKNVTLIAEDDGTMIGIIYYECSKPMMTGVAISIIINTINNYEKYYIQVLLSFMNYVFKQQNYYRITIYISELVIIRNKELITKMEENGFLKEGILKEERYINGKFYDTYIMGVTREDKVR
ncbi:RimJ/RimL family protein N-acetyltransferase [Lachnotalea glycerini]|uniref:N-acetyltransferase n=1 Tax=Lachnotalea glycerini TaxID=1763509 RepID=A0A255I3U2_9FIRM|nr:GNAT family protein [Lachnotalea glycerini]PXV93855.1 RimJ/RimL family protein N-acetyltransferase [Lachnotalea glycerini]RDY30907.1 N-acetyltransferase [Lachnotalea glycerini]